VDLDSKIYKKVAGADVSVFLFILFILFIIYLSIYLFI